MNRSDGRTGRRRALGALAATLAAAAGFPPRLAARQPTPAQTPGPFYPLELPLDSDNDLVQVRGSPGTADGTVVHVSGRVTDERGRALPRVLVEIWQCDAHGRYHHPRDRREAPYDPDFQGYGRSVTGPDGRYLFRTIRPVPYPGRTPHIHFAVRAPGRPPLVTQMYVRGDPGNASDRVLAGIDPALREAVVVALDPLPDRPGALSGRFDIVLGPGLA